MGLCAAIGLMGITATTTFAADDKDHKEGGAVKPAGTVEGIMTQIHEHHMELAETVKNKKLADVHHHAFAIRDLAKALPAKVPADDKAKVQGTVNNIAKLAEALDQSGDANDQAKTEANLKKLDGLIKMLETHSGKHDHK